MSTPFAAMAEPSREWNAGAWLLRAMSVSALLSVACNVNNPGVTPPERELNYPLVLTTSATAPGAEPDWLYVVNTNYNLRFNAGSLQSFDLEEVERALDRSCQQDVLEADCLSVGGDFTPDADACNGAGADAGAAESCEVRGRCCIDCRQSPRDILCDSREHPALQACCYDSLRERRRQFVPDGGELLIQSFVSGIALSSSGERLYMSVRGNDALLTVDVDGGQLRCDGSRRKCPGSAYLGALEPLEGTQAQFGRLPLALATASASDFGVPGDEENDELIFTGHADGSISFLVDDGTGPVLRAELPPLVSRINSMRFNPETGLIYVAQESTTEVARLGAKLIDDEITPFSTTPLQLRGLSDNTFARDLAFSPRDPDRVHALVRGGSTAVVRSLYFLDLDPTEPAEAQTVDVARVGFGPARLVEATLGSGVDARSYLFVSCYDDRSLFIFDAATRQLVAFVRGLLGPFEFSIDSARELAYIADFASSTLRVVDLRALRDPSQPKPRIVLTLGQPRVEGSDL